MGCNFFKRRKSNNHKEDSVQEQSQIIAEKVYSRFTFAHNNDDIFVIRYYLDDSGKSAYTEISEDTVFISGDIFMINSDNSMIIPVFKTPKNLPKTRLVTGKKVICIGSLIINDSTDEIIGLSNNFTGMSLEDIVNDISIQPLNETSEITVMDRNNVIVEEVISGDIDIDTFEKSVTLKNTINSLMNN